jgi:hypothetical protein
MHYQKKRVSACNAHLTASIATKTITASRAQLIPSMLVECAPDAPQAVTHARTYRAAPSAALDTSYPLPCAVLALRDAAPALLAPAMSALPA